MASNRVDSEPCSVYVPRIGTLPPQSFFEGAYSSFLCISRTYQGANQPLEATWTMSGSLFQYGRSRRYPLGRHPDIALRAIPSLQFPRLNPGIPWRHRALDRRCEWPNGNLDYADAHHQYLCQVQPAFLTNLNRPMRMLLKSLYPRAAFRSRALYMRGHPRCMLMAAARMYKSAPPRVGRIPSAMQSRAMSTDFFFHAWEIPHFSKPKVTIESRRLISVHAAALRRTFIVEEMSSWLSSRPCCSTDQSRNSHFFIEHALHSSFTAVLSEARFAKSPSSD